ncbi:CDP-alcohol phosphatidyltransferase family protein [Terracoccus luteus]|uniref:Cardiolipin synthase n=1 Tax=Terracoccus luteus TaxID=53356 RepID=A0A839Q6E1_9MICO|nr:CDP-alcohol phosphatidyltransferase family protein [Terracoccus luteus]MBB2988211.1 cardiolipin synthase [Terracoccus luteus]MCP2173846.1 cardiolipin synthase [Terracoccus luteus]
MTGRSGTQRQSRDKVLTLPNVLSMLRLVGVPIFLWAILSQRDLLAFGILALSGATDYADGKIARAFGMESALGAMLDPVADRLYILTTLVGLAWRDIIPVWLVVVLLAREVVMALMLLVLQRRGQTGLPVHFVGKAATFNLLYAFPLLLLAHRDDWLGAVSRPLGWGFAWWGVGLYWLAAVLYAIQARQVLSGRPAASGPSGPSGRSARSG